MIKLNQVRAGSKVMVKGGFGTEPERVAVITGVESDIKNGRPGIEYVEIGSGQFHGSGQERWAYLTQVTCVVKY